MSYPNDKDVELFAKAEAAAKAGNARMAEAFARLERMNIRLEQLRQESEALANEYDVLEHAIIRDAIELE